MLLQRCFECDDERGKIAAWWMHNVYDNDDDDPIFIEACAECGVAVCIACWIENKYINRAWEQECRLCKSCIDCDLYTCYGVTPKNRDIHPGGTGVAAHMKRVACYEWAVACDRDPTFPHAFNDILAPP